MSGATSPSKSESIANVKLEVAKTYIEIVIVRSKSVVSVDRYIMNGFQLDGCAAHVD